MLSENKYRDIFNKLSKPVLCGMIDEKTGRRHYKSRDGRWSNEMIFILEEDIHKDNPTVIHRSYFDTDKSWKKAIEKYLKFDRAFKHPVTRMICLQENGLVTARNLNFDLDILSV